MALLAHTSGHAELMQRLLISIDMLKTLFNETPRRGKKMWRILLQRDNCFCKTSHIQCNSHECQPVFMVAYSGLCYKWTKKREY